MSANVCLHSVLHEGELMRSKFNFFNFIKTHNSCLPFTIASYIVARFACFGSIRINTYNAVIGIIKIKQVLSLLCINSDFRLITMRGIQLYEMRSLSSHFNLATYFRCQQYSRCIQLIRLFGNHIYK